MICLNMCNKLIFVLFHLSASSYNTFSIQNKEHDTFFTLRPLALNEQNFLFVK